jgi:hypothetical protein
VEQQLCWIRARQHDSARWEAWLRLGKNLGDPASAHEPSSAARRTARCIASSASRLWRTLLCGQRGDAWLLLGFRQPLDKGHDDEDHDNVADTDNAGTWGRTVHVRIVLPLSRSACFSRAVECDRYDRATTWVLLVASMRDDEYVAGTGAVATVVYMSCG